ncbi:MAG: peptidoglycan-binding protein [Cellvibrionaceae bacterium]|nr:peptidoglycan-binding protein [Cellvibrionaceae bacterium]MCV6627375.1 peptidoglycan-binding protein [Cellvibrionaceae bacterium]
MKNSKWFATAILFGLGGCSGIGTEQSYSSNSVDTNGSLQEQLAEREQALKEKDERINQLHAQLQGQSQSSYSVDGGDLLPPGAKAGECYARVWVEPQYKSYTESYVAQEASHKVRIEPAQYEWQTESVLVREASEERIPVPAQYGFENETIQISDERRLWRTRLKPSSPEADAETLKAARAGGIDIDGAPVNSCYHEHYTQPEYGYEEEQVLISEASEKVVTTEAEYQTVEERVLVQEASTRIEQVPAVYETVSEKVLDKPAHTVWKKGTGPIQRIDAATGEIMCLVEVPATYKTIKRRVIKTPASTREIEVPAQYKTVKVRKKVRDGEEQRIEVPAEYRAVRKKVETKPGAYVWHEIADKSMSKESRTGRQICLVEEPAKYKTVKRRVVTKPASVKVKTIPAEYKDVKVRKLVAKAREVREEIPEVTKTVTRQELVRKGQMEWRSILCETNMTTAVLRDIQNALKAKGYNPGKIDGVIGADTMEAVNKFQRDKELPVDRYLNMETLRALGIRV